MFQFDLIVLRENLIYKTVPMKNCDAEDWKDLGNDYKEQF
jgi:hypothetical protein